MAFEKKRRSQSDRPNKSENLNEIRVSDDELEEAAAVSNPYYARVAGIYSAVRYALLIFLIAFLVAAAISSPESISYDNLMFLMKDLGSVAEASGGNFETITYNPDTTLSFAGFRKNLAVATSAGLRIYEGDGSLLFEGKDKFSKPLIETSNRYLLVYDFGGNSYAIYNSFARIYTEKLDYEITGADISDSGMFAVVTKTKEYNSAVLLYTKNCNLKNRYLSEDRVIDVSINDSGSRVCILTFDAENASFITKIKISKPGDDAPITTLELQDIFPLACEFTSDGNLTVFCDKALYFYDSNGNLIGSFTLGGKPEAARLCEEGTVISLPKNAVTTGSNVTVLDSRGNIIYSGEISGKTSIVDYKNGYLFSLSGNILTRTDVKTSENISKEVSGSGKTMVVYSENDIMICSASCAEYYDFED
ncbi:MAG: hypothetical protein IJZ89_06980 [Clostridia bacterium]|nr:hypothetical protein [Clostridia bacterium]